MPRSGAHPEAPCRGAAGDERKQVVAALLCLLLAVSTTLAGGAEAYREALERFRAGDFAGAAGALERAIAAGDAGAGHHALLGWCELRRSRLTEADAAFVEAARRDPDSVEPAIGRGYVALREARLDDAESFFAAAVERSGDNADAWKGLGLALRGRGEHKGAREALLRALELQPDDAETRRVLDENLRLIVEERRPREAVAAGPPVVPARAANRRFELHVGDSWEPMFVKGVNMGTALPGKLPAEFPDDERLYRRWFEQIGELGANVVRTYTLHPPSFYRTLRAHNRDHPDRKLWLIQGAWTGLPPEHDYSDATFDAGFRAEIRRVIDAVHGNLELPARPGHADGSYDTDVSQDLLAWLLGREWEPFSIEEYHEKRPRLDTFAGRYVQARDVQPIEAWLASICETAIEHETEYYGMQHPVGYTSWPTLDPLVHPTEATVEEELRIRARLGDPSPEEIKEYDNDLINIDSTLILPTAAFGAGIYGSYHAYPYYPEFMMLDPGYARVEDDQGVARYLGYLQDLARHHGDQPVLIAEFGVPTSRGIAHLQPEGQHHGGHNSISKGEVDARLMRNIHQAGLAGGIVFAWMDEWFKRNWIVMNYESPPERNHLWLNALDAEQNYGLLGAFPGASGWTVVLDGRADDWDAADGVYAKDGGVLRRLLVDSDAAYVYLLLEVAPDAPPGTRYWIGIDTYSDRLGDHRFPEPLDRYSLIGLEFLVQLGDAETSRLLVDRPYDLFSNRNRRPYGSKNNENGDFVEIVTFTNRDRYGPDGSYYPPRGYSRSPLRYGSLDRASPDFDDLADWYRSPDGRLIEIRLPWGLINVADPSTRRVIHEIDRVDDVVQTTLTEGLRFHVLALDGDDSSLDVVDSFPAKPSPELGDFPAYSWPTWEQPDYRLELKPSYFVLKEQFSRLP